MFLCTRVSVDRSVHGTYMKSLPGIRRTMRVPFLSLSLCAIAEDRYHQNTTFQTHIYIYIRYRQTYETFYTFLLTIA